MKTRVAVSRHVIRLWLELVIIALLSPALSSAGEVNRMHILSVGAGISSPGATTSLVENPAGLSYNNGFTAQFSAGSDSDPPSDPWDLGFGGYMGNGTVGGALKVDDQSSSANQRTHSGGGSSTQLTGGLGANLSSVNSSIGTSCGTSLGSTVSASCSNFGLIYAPTESPRFGLQVVTSAPSTEYGFGVAGGIAQNVTLALDASAQSGGVGMKPGIGFDLAPLQLALGDGFGLSNGANTGLIRTGVSVGVGFTVSQSVQLESYYNQIAEFYLALDVRF